MAEMSDPTSLSPQAVPVPKANILLVDDNPANILTLRAILDDLDQNLVGVTSGEEALLRMLQADFAVVLLDVQMHGMDGFDEVLTI